MPVYNSFEYLTESVNSILKQTHENFEFLILNDCSMDKRVDKLINDMKKQDYRISYYVSEKNFGVTRSLNLLLGLAKGEIIFRQDSDDISELNRLEEQLNYFQLHSDAGATCTISNKVDKNSKLIGKSEYFRELGTILQNENPVVHGSVAFRKDVLKKIGIYDDRFPICQSYEMWRRINKYSKMDMLNKCLYSIRKHQDSYTAVNLSDNLKARKIIMNLKDEEIKKIDNFGFYQKYSKMLVDKIS